MWNKGRKQGKGQHVGRGFCICLKCGYSKPHISGNPCRALTCPVCHVPLVSNNSVSQVNIADTNNIKTKTIDFPRVNPKICTDCGICIDSCPIEAIALLNDVAFIDTDKCSNCRVCVDDCPNEAIS